MLRYMIDRASGFSRLVRHSAWKRSGPILTTQEPAQGFYRTDAHPVAQTTPSFHHSREGESITLLLPSSPGVFQYLTTKGS